MLGDLTSIGTLFAFVLVSLGVMILRIRRPDIPRAFKVPGGPYLVPLLGAGSGALHHPVERPRHPAAARCLAGDRPAHLCRSTAASTRSCAPLLRLRSRRRRGSDHRRDVEGRAQDAARAASPTSASGGSSAPCSRPTSSSSVAPAARPDRAREAVRLDVHDRASRPRRPADRRPRAGAGTTARSCSILSPSTSSTASWLVERNSTGYSNVVGLCPLGAWNAIAPADLDQAALDVVVAQRRLDDQHVLGDAVAADQEAQHHPAARVALRLAGALVAAADVVEVRSRASPRRPRVSSDAELVVDAHARRRDRRLGRAWRAALERVLRSAFVPAAPPCRSHSPATANAQDNARAARFMNTWLNRCAGALPTSSTRRSSSIA